MAYRFGDCQVNSVENFMESAGNPVSVRLFAEVIRGGNPVSVRLFVRMMN